MEHEETKITVNLKLAHSHPNNAFRVLDVVVSGYAFKPYEIGEDVAKMLMEDEGTRHWVVCEELQKEESEQEEDEEETTDPVVTDPVVTDPVVTDPVAGPADVETPSERKARLKAEKEAAEKQ